MSDTATQIRNYYEAVTVRVDADEILEQWVELTPRSPRRPTWLRGPVIAVGVAVLLVLVIGIVAVLGGGEEPLIDEPEPTTTTVTDTSVPIGLPTFTLADLSPFEATIQYGPATVVVSYGADGRFRREIVALDPPDLEFHWGQVGDYYVTDGANSAWKIPDLAEPIEGPDLEPLFLLGPLFWSSWEPTCADGRA